VKRPAGAIAKSLGDALVLAGLAAAPLGGALLLLRASLASPRGLWLGALAAPIVLFHLLRPKREARVVGSVLLWREVERALEARHPLARLRRNLPLWLELFALASLAVALATPLVPGGRGGGAQDVIIIIDASASMKAADGPRGETRFDRARAEAREIVRGLRSGERALILLVTPRGPRTARGWTDDPAALEEALASIEATDGPAELGDALVLAAATARRNARERAEVVVFSDGGGPEVPALDFSGKLRYRAVGSSHENVGITAVELRDEDEPGDEHGARRVSVFASVLNAGERGRDVWLELRAFEGDDVLAARRLELAPGGRAATVLDARLSPGPFRVRLSPAPGDPEHGRALDALPSDDEVVVVVSEAREARVALVSARKSSPSDHGSPLARALAACGGARVELRELRDAFDPSLRLVVFDGVVPERLPRTNCLIVNPSASLSPAVKVGEPVLEPRLSAWDRDDPLLRFVDLSDVLVSRAKRLTLGAGARALVSAHADAAELPLLAAWSDGDASRIVVGFDLAESNWPLRLSFPIFVRNCVLAALADEALGPRGTIRAGTPVVLRAPSQAAVVRVTTPSGRAVEVRAEDGRALFAETDEAGLYRVTSGDLASAFAVAVLDEEETRIAPRSSLRLGSDAVAAQPAAGEGLREMVVPFVALALLALLVEGFAFHRRW
jgi:hypothetical protein